MKTIIAAFGDNVSAQQAVDFLHSRGVDDIQMMSYQDGNIINRLVGYHVPKDRAELYAEAIRRGAPLLIAHTTNADANKLANELDNMGSLDLDAAASRWRSEGWRGFDTAALPYDAEQFATEQQLLRQESLRKETLGAQGEKLPQGGDIDVIEEKVAIGKRQVARGGVRVRTFVVERPVQEQVELHEERIDIAREPVDERISANAADSTFTEDEFVVTARGEEAVVGKEARVVERVHVGKTADTRTETISETERRRDVEVEKLEGDETTRPLPDEPRTRRP